MNSIVTSWNPAAEHMFGYTAQEMIGRSLRLIIPPDRQPEEDDVLARIGAGDRVEHFETQRLRKDGSIVHVSLSISSVRDGESESSARRKSREILRNACGLALPQSAAVSTRHTCPN